MPRQPSGARHRELAALGAVAEQTISAMRSRPEKTMEDERRSALADAPSRCGHALRCACLELGVSLEDQVADTNLRGNIVNRSQEREAAALPA